MTTAQFHKGGGKDDGAWPHSLSLEYEAKCVFWVMGFGFWVLLAWGLNSILNSNAIAIGITAK